MSPNRSEIEQVLRKHNLEIVSPFSHINTCSHGYYKHLVVTETVVSELLSLWTPPSRDTCWKLMEEYARWNLTHPYDRHEGWIDKFMTWAGAGRPTEPSWCAHMDGAKEYSASIGYGNLGQVVAGESFKFCPKCGTPRPGERG